MSNPTSFYSVYIQFFFLFKLNWTARKAFTQGGTPIRKVFTQGGLPYNKDGGVRQKY